jgi:hypothetical protein
MSDVVSASLRRLVAAANLVNISFMQISAIRHATPVAPSESGIKPAYALNLAVSTEPEPQFRLQLRCEVQLPTGSVVVEPAATYRVSPEDADLLTPSAITEYANEVGVMALIPYLRHALADVTLRVLDEPLIMPILPRGAIHFEWDGQDPA